MRCLAMWLSASLAVGVSSYAGDSFSQDMCPKSLAGTPKASEVIACVETLRRDVSRLTLEVDELLRNGKDIATAANGKTLSFRPVIRENGASADGAEFSGTLITSRVSDVLLLVSGVAYFNCDKKCSETYAGLISIDVELDGKMVGKLNRIQHVISGKVFHMPIVDHFPVFGVPVGTHRVNVRRGRTDSSSTGLDGATGFSVTAVVIER